MKVSEIKTLKGNVGGVRSTLVRSENVDKSLGNILFCLGFEQIKGFYYKHGDLNIFEEAKNYIKKSIYVGGEDGEMSFVEHQFQDVDKITDLEELNKAVNKASLHH